MNTKFKVLITDRFDVEALALLKADPSLSVTISALPKPSTDELLNTDALIIRSRTRIDDSLLHSSPNLKLIITSTSGFDHIDLGATVERGVKVMYTPEANAASACEITWALILACSRRLIEAHRAVKNNDWRREALLGRELSGKTLGIVGLGRIGSRVARVAQAFGMKVVGFDPYKEEAGFRDLQTERVSFEELLKLSDVVTFHVPSTDETKNMLSAMHLESMNRTAILVNASRGSIVKERDLVQALSERWIAACGLDVYEREPLPQDSKLNTLPNLVLSPHLGATTSEAFSAASREAAEKVLAFAKSGVIRDPLPPEEAWYEAGFLATTPGSAKKLPTAAD